MVIPSEGPDAVRYAERLINMAKIDFSFSEFISSLYTEETMYLDILQPFVTFIISRFTTNAHILFATFGLLYGYFYSRNIWLLLQRMQPKYHTYSFIFLIAFILIAPIWNINGFRFGIAIQIYLYGVLSYLLTGNRNKVLISALAIFAHFSFVAPVMLLLGYIFLRNRSHIYFTIFVISFFISEIEFGFIKTTINNLPSLFRTKSEIYLVDDYLINRLEIVEQKNWYIRYYTPILKWISFSFLSLLYFYNRKDFKSSLELGNLFSFTLLFYAYANIAFLLPQGVRFYPIANALVLFLLSVYPISFKSNSMVSIIRKLYIPFILIIIISSLRKGMNFTGLLSIFGNPLLFPFIGSDFPIIELIK